MRKSYALILGGVLAVTMFVALLGLMGSPSTYAAPSAAPTPVSNLDRGGLAAKTITLWSAQVMTADGNSSVQNILTHDAVDLQWKIDQTLKDAVMNTTTLKLQYSVDGTNWVDGASFVSANVADVGDLQQYALFGQFLRVNADVANTNPVTITVIGVAK
jgi:hypothetical protein